MRPALLLAAAAGLIAAGLALSVALLRGPSGGSGGAGHTPDLARGAEIYAEACAACHGAQLEGAPNWRSPGPNGRLPAPPHDISGHTWHHSDRVLLDITMRGTAAVVGNGYESDMPGFADLYSEAELRDVLAWIKTHWPERARLHQQRLTEQDRALR
jgi:mono/diheme cytochrome c family protein